MQMIAAVESSKDPLVKECFTLLVEPEFVSDIQLPQEPPLLLKAARESISQVTRS